MRRQLLLFFSFIQITVLQAQILRVSAGLNLNSYSKNTELFKSEIGGGFQFGLDTRLESSRHRYYFQPGVQYAVVTSRLIHPTFTDQESKLSVSGIKIPMLFGVRFHISSSSVLRGFAGPSFMTVTRVKHKEMEDVTGLLTDKNYHDVEWAAHLGMGLDVQNFFVDVGFQKGLTYSFTGSSDAKSNLLYMSVGIKNILYKSTGKK